MQWQQWQQYLILVSKHTGSGVFPKSSKKIYDVFIESVMAENEESQINVSPLNFGDEFEFDDTTSVIPEW